MSDAVTVVIAVYDRADQVGEAIASVLAQSHPDVRVRVVDDGSTDGTAEVLDGIAAAEPRVQVAHQPNRGPAAARNRALAGCETEWVAFLDSDDLLLPDAIERHFAWLAEHPDHDGVMGSTEVAVQDGIVAPELVREKVETDADGAVFQTVLIPKRLIDEVGGYDESLRLGEDTDLHWRLVEAGARIGDRPEPVIVRRVFGDNLTYDIDDWRQNLLEIARRSVERRLGGAGGDDER